MGLGEFNKVMSQRMRELIPVQTHWATVKSVNWDARQMVATGLVDDLDFFGVLLGLGAQAVRPSVGSKCLIGTVQNDAAATFLIWADQIAEFEITDATGFKVSLKDGEMTLNGNTFGGIVKADELRSQVERNSDLLDQIKQAFSNWTPVSEDGGAALKALSSAFTGMPTADLSNIENPKIKHG